MLKFYVYHYIIIINILFYIMIFYKGRDKNNEIGEGEADHEGCMSFSIQDYKGTREANRRV